MSNMCCNSSGGGVISVGDLSGTTSVAIDPIPDFGPVYNSAGAHQVPFPFTAGNFGGSLALPTPGI